MASVDYPVMRRPRLKGGIGANAAVMLWAIAAVIGISIGFPWGLLAGILALLIQGVLMWAFKEDHKILAVYGLYATLPDEFHAGIPPHHSINSTRPDKFGKGVSQ